MKTPQSTPADPQPSILDSQPAFPCLPGETPRAFAAFIAFFGLGQSRSLPALAKNLGEKLGTLKKWSTKFHWNDRIQAFHSGRLQQQLQAEEAARRQQAADWRRRAREYREQQFIAAQKLLALVRCCLESFGDEQLEKMNLAQVSRALQVASDLALKSFSAAGLPDDTPSQDPREVEFRRALEMALRQAQFQAAPGL